MVLDLRCLQDPLFAGRGVGRQADALLRHARACGVARLTGLLDSALPELPVVWAGLLDGVRHTAYTGALTRPTCLVSLSPMTHDPLFTARLLHHPAVFAAAAVDGFLPLDEPARYMPMADARLEYHISLRWLARHDLFLATTHNVVERLGTLLGVRPHEAVVTGMPVHPRFEPAGPGTRRHVLVVANGDARRDPETVVRAHARSRSMQAGVRLVVTGVHGAWLQQQRRAAEALGGRGELIEAPGRVDDAVLARLYQDALCVVAPAWADGFSLPAVEAMAAGAPVLASRIPAHAELLPGDALFDAGDDTALAGLLDQMAGPWRADILAEQAPVWPRYREAAVAERFWGAVLARMGTRPAPAVSRGARARVAVIMPERPSERYDAALCGALGRQVDMQVSGPADTPASTLPYLSSNHDRVISFLRPELQGPAYQCVLRHGGACIGLHGDALPSQEIMAVAEPLLLHSPAGVAAVQRRSGSAVHLPFGLARTWPAGALDKPARQAARDRLVHTGAGPRQVVLGLFGSMPPTRALEDCVWALELLRGWGVDARLHVMGLKWADAEPLDWLCAELGIRQHVWFADRGNKAAYQDHLLAADVGVDVRSTLSLGASEVLADCLGAGLRTVTSAALADAAGAPGYVVTVPDHLSPVLLAEAVMALLDRSANTEAERLAYAADRSMDRTAARLCEALGLP